MTFPLSTIGASRVHGQAGENHTTTTSTRIAVIVSKDLQKGRTKHTTSWACRGKHSTTGLIWITVIIYILSTYKRDGNP